MRNTVEGYKRAAESMDTVDAGLGQDLYLAAADLEDIQTALAKEHAVGHRLMGEFCPICQQSPQA